MSRELIERLRKPIEFHMPPSEYKGDIVRAASEVRGLMVERTEAAAALESSEAETERLKQSNNEAQSEIDDLTEDLERAEAESSRLRERVRELEEGLKPFAKLTDGLTPDMPDGTWVARTNFCNNQVTAYSVRHASSLLDKTESKS